MDFIANKEEQNRQMLEFLGISNVDELFRAIPQALMRCPPIGDDGLSEYEALKLMESIASENTFSIHDNYLGAGSYEHHFQHWLGRSVANRNF